MKLRNLYLILGVLVIALLLPYSALAGWRTECVDCPRYFGNAGSRSLALDSSGNPHIVYGGGDGIYYAYYDGLSWHIETVDIAGEGADGSPSIAIDSLDKVHISYNLGDLKYATNTSGSWVIETVDSEGGTHPSIAMDSLDNVHISYNLDDLKYATNTSGSWVIETVDSEGGTHPSIAMDSLDNVHISYGYRFGYPDFSSGLKYATNASGSWVTETVDSDDNDGSVGANNSIAIDSLDKAHISYSYYSGYPDYVKALKYATNASGSWVTQSVNSEESVGANNSIAIDSLDNVHISYDYNFGYPDYVKVLKYATNASGSWVTQSVNSEGGAHLSIAIDSSDNVHISYISFNRGGGRLIDNEFADLKYAVNSSGSWVIKTVDSSGGIKKNSSVAIDSSDNVHVTYVGPQGLMYATNASGSWVTELIERTANTFYGDRVRYPSIAIDSSDKVHISYSLAVPDYGYFQFYLKYATNASGSWVIETVRNEGVITSIAIDSSDKVHIAYTTDAAVNYSTRCIYYHLKYATNASGSWVTETVDNRHASNLSIAIDSSDNVYIAYYYWFPLYSGFSAPWYNDIRYATNASGLWAIKIVDDEGNLSHNTNPSIAIDSSDNAHISYSTEYPWNLKYATNASDSWVIETLNSAGGGASSVAIDSSDNVHISYTSYYDYPYSDLKYATNASGSWVFETVDSNGRNPSMAIDSSDNVHIVYYDTLHHDLRYATNKPFPHISVTDSVDPADDLLIPFGEARGGRRVRQTATATNIGRADLEISAVYLTGADTEQFYIRKDNCSDTALSSSGSCTIEVVFRPAEAGVYSARLGIYSNDPDTPELYVELTGTSVTKRTKGRNSR